ncbi:unnamed protein product [Dovyalis caffra]|uniref:Uncharacterized protein n=1 Tax=Dovyalis caffra TaxID=77055 RepID=A0AAV1RUK7_9ROSI|nr:unnamed protein product [Dovyalis caffra]
MNDRSIASCSLFKAKSRKGGNSHQLGFLLFFYCVRKKREQSLLEASGMGVIGMAQRYLVTERVFPSPPIPQVSKKNPRASHAWSWNNKAPRTRS